MSPIQDLIASGLISQDVDLGPLTTYKAGGKTRFYAKPENRDQLRTLADQIARESMPVLILGRGSNLLVSDSGFDGMTIHMAQGFSNVEFDGLSVVAGSGAPLPRLARNSVAAGIAGLEFFVGVPGSVGGAVRQNAGCFGTETKDRLIAASLIDLGSGEEFTATRDELQMSYRHTAVRPHWVVMTAEFRGTSSDVSQSGEKLKEITRWRKENQPGGTLNAGSVFKNPEEASAGFLIEDAGLKGHSIGNVSVSMKHANFFVASRGASSADVRELVLEVQRLVLADTGILLEPEIQFVGFDDDD